MEKNEKLAPNWSYLKIGDIVSFDYGKGLVSRKRNLDGETPVYGSNGIVGYHDEALVEEPCLIVGRKGAAGSVHISMKPCWPIDTTYFVIPPKNVNLKFLYYLFTSLQLGKLDKSTTIPGLNRNDAYNLTIPVPSLGDQEKIAMKIEELFSQLDAGVAGLKRAQTALKRYRASVLKAAVEGNLFKEQQSTSGIPEGWQNTAIKRIATNDKNSIKRGPFGSSVKKAYFVTEGYKIYQQRNVIDNDFSYGDYYIDSERFEKLKAFEIFPGDILITGAGTIGKFAVVPENIQPGIMNQALLKISLNPELIITDFFFYFFEVKAREYLLAKTRGSAMKNISSVRDLKEMEILLPPINEQTKIVEEVERQLTIINEINASIEKTQNFSSNISHSILKQAFQGKLL